MKHHLDQMTREVMRDIQKRGVTLAKLLTKDGDLYRLMYAGVDEGHVWLLDVNTTVWSEVPA